MKIRMRWIAALSALCVGGAGCATVPYTNRSQIMMVSEAEEAQLGIAAYRQSLTGATVVRGGESLTVVQRVGERIARVADRPDFQWEFHLVQDDKQANAYCLPGGKVAIYTGIFPAAYDEAGLAAVMGHEAAHAIARHGAERMSQGMAAQVGGAVVSGALGASGAGQGVSQLAMAAYGLGAQVGVMLPYSRSHESEADQIGMILMAKAGYDPAAALDLWDRMDRLAAKEGGKPPEFLSTHPGSDTRKARIRDWLPEARRQYRADPSVVVRVLPGVKPAPPEPR